MVRDELNHEYFEWMYQLVFDSRYSRRISYRNLLAHLYNVSFAYTIEMDGNRAADGEDLRYRFGRERGYEDSLTATQLDTRPCSVLEMMIALALRCEENIMEDADIGNRTGQWFWNMVVSLGLGSMTDLRYDEDYVDYVLERFMNHSYERDGEGGLFTVKHCRKDMRTMEIWYQMHAYLESVL